MSGMSVRLMVAAGAAAAIAAISALAIPVAHADDSDPVGSAASGLSAAPVYVSAAATAYIGAVDTRSVQLPTDTKVAVLSDDDGSAGQLAAAISSRLSTTSNRPLTVGVLLVSADGLDAFDAVSSSKAYCKGGADLAARDALSNDTSSGVSAVLGAFARKLATLPPDRGESSCASAEAGHGSNSWQPWLWLLLAAVVGGCGIGGFAWYVRRTVRARGADGQTTTDGVPDWIIVDETIDEGNDETDDELIDDQ